MAPGTDPDPGIYQVVGAQLDGYAHVATDLLSRDGRTYALCIVGGEWALREDGDYKVSKATYELLAAGEASGSTFASEGETYMLAISGDYVVHVRV